MTIGHADSPMRETPVVELGVPGPRGEQGLILWALGDPTVAWDVEQEVASARRRWMHDREGWWVDLSYFDTVLEITLRGFSSVLVVNGRGGDRLVSRDGSDLLQGRLL